MKVLIVIGHPNSLSFNHALADVCRKQLIKNGHTVYFHDLYKEKFNPVLYSSDNSKEDGINDLCAELANSDGIIVVHPNWWGQPPAIIKGWIDRVFVRGVAYTLTDGTCKGLLKAKAALVLNTSNTAEELEEKVYKDPLETLWKTRVFQYCGITNFRRINYNVIKDSNLEQRRVWLSELQKLITTYFPKED